MLRKSEWPNGGLSSKVACCHIACCRLKSRSLRESSVGVPRTYLAEERGCASPRCSVMPFCSGRCLSKRLQATLKWSSPVPLVVLTLYADATGHGTLAWAAEGLSKRVFSRGFVPGPLRRWVHQRRHQITTWELVAALCAVWYFLRLPARLSACHLQINLFIDSDVALGTLLRGMSRQSHWNDLVTGIWFEAAAQAALLLA